MHTALWLTEYRLIFRLLLARIVRKYGFTILLILLNALTDILFLATYVYNFISIYICVSI